MKTIRAIRWDEWDGGDRQNFRAYLDISNDVETLKKDFRFDAFTPVVLTIFDNVKEIEDNSIANLRKAAWHKLTPQERAALHLPVEEPK